jgi:predicted Zn-dependent protease
MNANWTFDQLKSQLLNHKDIKAWIVHEEHIHRRERYFMQEDHQFITDQDRNINTKNTLVRLFVSSPTQGRQGEITKKFFTSSPLKEQISQAVEMAKETDHQTWALPFEVPTTLFEPKTTDPLMAEDLETAMNSITSQIEVAVSQPRETVFNSSEVFLSVHNHELHLSNGLVHRYSQSRIYVEAAFSFTKPHDDGVPRSDEFLSTQWAGHLDDIQVGKLFEDTSDRASKSLDTVKPETGNYSIIIDSEVLSTLLNGHLSQLSASHAYNGLPFIKPGAELIPNSTGDLLSITLDPTLDYGASSISVSEQGIAQKPLRLVNNNSVIATATDKQYGDYLGIPATTVRGNLVIDPGKLTHHELTQQADQVIEILQFSGLFADINSGTFSSEIRLARLYDNKKGTISYIKGGSLSGSIIENFKGLKLSRSRVRRSHFSSETSPGQGYYGPDFALITNVSIVG